MGIWENSVLFRGESRGSPMQIEGGEVLRLLGILFEEGCVQVKERGCHVHC